MNTTFANMDNFMGLLPEAIAARVDELMESLWDRNGYAMGSVVFAEIVHAYQDLGLDTKTHREWDNPDINSLLTKDFTVVRG